MRTRRYQHYLKLTTNMFFVTVLCLIPFISGWGNFWKERAPLFIIVLVDETGSFRLEQDDPKTHYWPEVVSWVEEIVKSLQPGDKFCLIGIDDSSYGDDDVRIGIESLDEGTLKAITERRKLCNKVNALKRREGARTTDIAGGLQKAAHFLNASDSKYKGVIAIFSDMIQTPWRDLKNKTKGLSFPKDTQGYCFYVNATNMSKWGDLVNAWIPIFENARLNIKGDDQKVRFYQRAQTGENISVIFPQN